LKRIEEGKSRELRDVKVENRYKTGILSSGWRYEKMMNWRNLKKG